MDNRLVLTFLFVTVAGGFMGTYAENSTTSSAITAATTTVAPATTTVAAATTTGAAATTTAGAATTTGADATTTVAAATTTVAAATTTGGAATTTVADATTTIAAATTTVAPATTTVAAATTTVADATTTVAAATTTVGAATTTVAPATTTVAAATTTVADATTTVAPATTTVGAATTTVAPATSVAATTTATGSTTTSASTSTTTITTTAPPITPNSTVTNLTTTISATSCGKTQLCAKQPSDCDPASGTGCFFLGVQQLSGQNFAFALSGNSNGYIAAVLLPAASEQSNGTVYICANNNGVVQYFSARYNNGKVNRTTLPVNNVKGNVNGSKIQCIFDVTVPDSNARAAATFSVSIATGSFNASTGDLGDPTTQIATNAVDLTNVNASTTNLITTTTVATTTAATTAAPITPNSTVTNLTTTISATNCGKKQLCAKQPSDCDPASGTGCFFLGVQQLSGQNFEFALSGNSNGYIAAVLLPAASLQTNGTVYICANNNSVVQYFSALYSNRKVNRTTLPVNNVQGNVNGGKIQCIFDVTVPDSSTRAAATYSIVVANGTFNASSGDLGDPSVKILTAVVDLTNTSATITNLISNTANAVTTQQSLMQALLITVGVLSLTML